MHKEQAATKRNVLQDASAVDDMYDLLLLHKEKLTTADEVRKLVLCRGFAAKAEGMSLQRPARIELHCCCPPQRSCGPLC